MVRIICMLFLFPAGIILAQGEWVKISSPTTNSLNSIFVYDTTNIWMAGEAGTIIYSSDAGFSWFEQNTGLTYPYHIRDIHFSDSLNGWAVSINIVNPPLGTTFLKTSDGGNNWEILPYPEEFIFLSSVFFFDKDYGFTAGSEGAIFKTTNGGESWKRCPVDSGLFRDLSISSLVFTDSLNGFASGGNFDVVGVIWRSTDGGETWWSTGVGPEPISDLYFIDSQKIVGVGGDFEFGTGFTWSNDNGMSWNYQSLDYLGIGSSINFRNASEVWVALRSSRFLLYSSDSANTWIDIPVPDSTYIFDLEFADSLTGVACGYEGVIFKWKKTLSNIIVQTEIPVKTFSLHPNYPNPFNPSTNIKL
jgi:photosystem II stability/assembly factor-like uncharacterized protein